MTQQAKQEAQQREQTLERLRAKRTERQHKSSAIVTQDTLAIRWFTPRGREARQQIVDDLRYHQGVHLLEIVEELRRRGVPPGRVDLRGIDLRGEDLAAASLANADLSGAMLDGCNLDRADLREAKLNGASMSGAHLRHANLEGSDLRGADLRDAYLREADLGDAKLDDAVLDGASFKKAVIAGVDLRKVDRSRVDLSEAFHRRPERQVRQTRRWEPVGRPPAAEPRHASERVTRRMVAPAPQAEDVTAGQVIRWPFQAATGDFDDALMELAELRDKVQEVRVVVNGVERTLYLCPPARKTG
ncbi:MAG: pentapeptide repeat-containing protein [Planctomycetes bacterium]|nr:pentapeptide repeat-containing protein [Planctomycetota bacterium]